MVQGPVKIESFGCTMNHGEARRAAELLTSMGIQVMTDDDGPSDDPPRTVLLFTCDVISTTERRMWRRMEEIVEGGQRLIVAGCLAAIASDEIGRRYPGASVVDSMGIDRLEASLWELMDQGSRADIDAEFVPSRERLDTIVPISTGCLGDCSYCITRVARGIVRSYDIDDIVSRVRAGVEKGRKEILLTSQDSAAYGSDRKDEDLGTLLRSITAGIGQEHRIRVGMMNPVLAKERLESILSGFDHPFVFKFFHVPVQSGSDDILIAMNRRYTTDDFRGMIDAIRSRIPGATISTDLIIGYPGETDQDHMRSLDLLRDVSPEILNITRYSKRPGTEAERRGSQIKGSVMKDRSRQTAAVHAEILRKVLMTRLGRHERCLVTEVGRDGTMMARDINYTPIVIDGGRELLGEFIDVRSSGTGPTYLTGGGNWEMSQ
ncbi:MAG: tRNA (N(6)-L-threonylcarbamoyladenosine(37)-C(2))-methylthiotransferase [Thermoplasmatota archaeon]